MSTYIRTISMASAQGRKQAQHALEEQGLEMKHETATAVSAPQRQAMGSDDVAGEAGEERTAQKRARIKFALPPVAKIPRKIPRATEVLWWTNPLVPVPPPGTVAQKLGGGLTIGIDIETHDWYSEPVASRVGRFGFWTTMSEDFFWYPRIVQIGWVVGEFHTAPHVVKQRLIRP